MYIKTSSKIYNLPDPFNSADYIKTSSYIPLMNDTTNIHNMISNYSIYDSNSHLRDELDCEFYNEVGEDEYCDFYYDTNDEVVEDEGCKVNNNLNDYLVDESGVLMPKWDKHFKEWVDDKYLDYSKFKKLLYTQRLKCTFTTHERDFILLDNYTGVKYIDEYIWHYYYFSCSFNNIGKDIIVKSKYVYNMWDNSCDFAAYDSTYLTNIIIENCNNVKLNTNYRGDQYNGKYIGFGILLSDAMQLSSVLGKDFVQDTLLSNTYDVLNIDENKINKEVKNRLSKLF